MMTLYYKKQSTSTNDEILGHINSNTTMVSVYTFDQTNGRGQYGNVWKITPDKNLAYSLAIPTKDVTISNILFNYHTALLFREYIAKVTNCKVEVKWPNDLIINNKKIAGMLIESKKVGNTTFLIIGMGINILQDHFEEMQKAGSILTTTQQKLDLTLFTENLDCFIKNRLLDFKSENEILKSYQTHLFRKNKVSVFQTSNIRQNGMIHKVDKEGYIWIELERDGLQKFFHKEIEMLY